MNGSGGFTQTIDWLAFTLPKAEVTDVITLIGGDWFQSETGFRGYPVAQLMTEGKSGVGKLGTGAPRNPKEVHVDLSAGIVSQWDETKLKTVLAWIFAHKGHVTRIDVALDDREACVAVETVRLAVEAGQVVSRSKQFKVIQASNHREGTRTGETLYFGSRESQTMLRRGAVRILRRRGGRSCRLLLRVLLRRTGRRGDRVHHDDVAGRDRLRFDRRRHLGRRHCLGDRCIGRLCRAIRANGIGVSFDGLRIAGRKASNEVGHLLLRRRNQRILNR